METRLSIQWLALANKKKARRRGGIRRLLLGRGRVSQGAVLPPCPMGAAGGGPGVPCGCRHAHVQGAALPRARRGGAGRAVAGLYVPGAQPAPRRRPAAGTGKGGMGGQRTGTGGGARSGGLGRAGGVLGREPGGPGRAGPVLAPARAFASVGGSRQGPRPRDRRPSPREVLAPARSGVSRARRPRGFAVVFLAPLAVLSVAVLGSRPCPALRSYL